MIPTALDSAFEQFAEACGDLGLPAWRVDTVRRDWRAPADAYAQAVAAHDAPMSAIVSAVAGNITSDQAYAVCEWHAGVFLLLVREEFRHERFGWVATVLTTAQGAQTLAHVCALEPDLNESALASSCVTGLDQSGRVARVLAGVYRRAASAADNESALDDFTTQLTIAYESSVLIGGIARSMNQIEDPRAFLTNAMDELYSALPFGWIALIRHPGAEIEHEMPESSIRRFDPKRFDAELIDEAAAEVLDLFSTATRLSIEPCPFGLDETLGPELVVQPILINGAPRALLVLGARAGAEWAVSSYDTLPVGSVAASMSVFLEIALAYRHQQESFMGTLRGLSRALDAKDTYTRGHSDRVAYLGEELARAAGLEPELVRQVRIAGIVHDIGKIGVPEAVLKGDRKLTDEEFAQIKQHPGIGFDILQGIPMLTEALPGVLHHHERFDGLGYPQGLAGQDIPLIARVLGIVDAFDAMSSNRKYQSGQAREVVLEEIRRCRGTHFDPDLADRFVELDFTEYDRMLETESAPAEPTERDRAA